jgi:hypothetical protein
VPNCFYYSTNNESTMRVMPEEEVEKKVKKKETEVVGSGN